MRYIAIITDMLAAAMWAYKGNIPMMLLFLGFTMIMVLSKD